MKKTSLGLFICLVLAFTLTAIAMPGGSGEPGYVKPEPGKVGEHLVSVEWIHRGDGGVITFTCDTNGAWTITKVFTPAKEGGNVPIIEPKKGLMKIVWFNKLNKSIGQIDFAQWKEEYPSEIKDKHNYKVTITTNGKTYTTQITNLDGNPNVPGGMGMITTIGWIMYDVHGKK